MTHPPTPIWSGTFRLLGVELKCHTLSDGQRIIEAESFDRFMEVLADCCGVDQDNLTDNDEEAAAFARWRAGG